MIAKLSFFVSYAALAAAGPVVIPRAVTSLDQGATAEAQQRDNTATRAFSNVQIKTSDGRCLFVDKLSGDFRENLTPIQVAACGSTDGQGWDVITSGKHIDIANSMLIVSTLTNACFNFDPRRAAGNQVLLFSCGGRADGGGQVTTSQVFSFNGGAGPLSFQPENSKGSCLTVKGNVLDVANCDSGDAKQSFTFGGGAGGAKAGGNAGAGSSSTTTTAKNGGGRAGGGASTSTSSSSPSSSSPQKAAGASSECGGRETVTVTVTVSSDNQKEAASKTQVAQATKSSNAGSKGSVGSGGKGGNGGAAAGTTTTQQQAAQGTGKAKAIANPTSPVPVSRAGGTLQPSSAAEANARDNTATRAFSSVEIRAPNGQCLFVDPTAGDFRENLIPVSLVDCSGTPNERWDVITAGKHNNAKGAALIVSTLMNGCISFDGRRAQGDTVTMFSCGGRGDGSGETNAGQLMPFIGAESFAFAPTSERGATCILPGNGRLESGPCPKDGSQLFSIFPKA